MPLPFDNERYLAAQTEQILKRVNAGQGRLFLEFGGKLIGDFHAARVLPGFDPDVKLHLLEKLAAGDVAKADAALVRRAEYPENLGRGKPYPKDE